MNKIIKIAGKATEITRSKDSIRPGYIFKISQGGNFIMTTYNGIVPDSFKEGADIVATGTLDTNKHFQATHILAKCSSKYQAKTNNLDPDKHKQP